MTPRGVGEGGRREKQRAVRERERGRGVEGMALIPVSEPTLHLESSFEGGTL